MGVYLVKFRVLVIIAIFASIVVSAPSLASPLLVSGVENPLPIFIPELLTAPAPSWVTEGVRFSYNTMVTYGSEEVNQYGFAISSDNAGTGAGITQLTVVGISGNSIAVTTDSYAPKPPYDTMHLVYSHGSVYPAGCGPFWVNPDVIAKVADKSTQTVVVTHLPYSTGGTAYEAIKFDFSSDGAGGILTIIYDLKTGMLLYHKLDIKNNALFQDGGEQYLRQSGSYSIFALRNIRTVQVPWMGGKMPTWVTDGLHLSYSGAKVFSVDGQIGPPAQYPRSSTYVFGSVTNRFVPLVVSTVSQDIITSQSSTPAVSGMAHIGGIFIPPEAMNLGTGTFDQDPDTGIISSITKNDYEGIVVTKTNGYDYTTEFWYNSFGKLIQMIITTMTTTNSGFGSLEQTTMKLL